MIQALAMRTNGNVRKPLNHFLFFPASTIIILATRALLVELYAIEEIGTSVSCRSYFV